MKEFLWSLVVILATLAFTFPAVAEETRVNKDEYGRVAQIVGKDFMTNLVYISSSQVPKRVRVMNITSPYAGEARQYLEVLNDGNLLLVAYNRDDQYADACDMQHGLCVTVKIPVSFKGRVKELTLGDELRIDTVRDLSTSSFGLWVSRAVEGFCAQVRQVTADVNDSTYNKKRLKGYHSFCNAFLSPTPASQGKTSGQ